MLVIFTQDEYKIVVEANDHDEAWNMLLFYENKLLTEANEANKKAKNNPYLAQTLERPPYTIDTIQEAWSMEGSTIEGVIELERGEIVYV